MSARRLTRVLREGRVRFGGLVAVLVLAPVLVLGGLQLSFATDNPVMDGLSSEPSSSVELFTGEPQMSEEATEAVGILDLLSAEETQVALASKEVGIAAAGSYSIKWSASDPELNRFTWAPTYDKLSPSYLAAQLGISYPYTGRYADPLDNAVAYGPTNIPSHYDAVTSLMPYSLALGTVVPFQMEITVSGSTAPENGTITVNPYWRTMTTSGSNFGVDPNYGVIAAFVDTADPGTVDAGGNATVSGLSWGVSNPSTSNETIDGAITITGLESGDKVIVETWVVLKNTVPGNATGNVHTGVTSASTTPPTGTGSSINVGNQTVPLMRVGSFFDASADLSITKSDNIDPVMVGEQLTYTIVVTNNSETVTANDVFLSDVLDPGLRLYPDSFTYEGENQTPVLQYGGTNFTLQLGALAPGESITITYVVLPRNQQPQTATEDSPADICDRINRVTVTSLGKDPNLANNTATECTGVIPRPVPKLAVAITSTDQCVPEPGGKFTFTYTVENTGTITTQVTGLFDSVIGEIPIPDNLWLDPGETYTTTATWTYSAVGAYTHYATVFSDEGSGICACSGSSFTVRVCPKEGPPPAEADVSVTKSGAPDPVRAGSTLNFSLLVKNESTFWSAEDVVLTDTLGPGLTFVPGSVIVLGAPEFIEGTFESGVLTVPIGDMAPRAEVSVIYQVTVDDIDPQRANLFSLPDIQDRHNTAVVTTTTTDPNAGNNTDTEYTGVMPIRNTKIEIEKSVTPEWTYEPGGTFTYTFDVWNSGDDTVTVDSLVDDVIGELELPEDVVLSPGERIESVVATWSHTGIGVYPNTVTASATNEDGDVVTAMDSASARVIPRLVDLSVTKRAMVQQVRPGDTFTYELIASNDTTIAAYNTVVTDTLGPGLAFVPGSVSVFGATPMSPPTIDGNVLSVPLGTLAPFQSVLISYRVTALPGSRPADGGAYSNGVVISGDDTDPNPDNDDDATDITPGPRRNADVTVEKSASPESRPSPGGEFTYTFKVWNSSDETITVESLYDDVLGELPLPEDVVLLPGEHLETVVVTAEHDRVGTYKNTVVVTAFDDGGELVEDTDSASVRVTLDLLPRTGADLLIWLVISGIIVVVAISLRGGVERKRISR